MAASHRSKRGCGCVVISTNQKMVSGIYFSGLDLGSTMIKVVIIDEAGFVENHTAAVVGVFCDNIKRFLAGEKLQRTVNPGRGY